MFRKLIAWLLRTSKRPNSADIIATGNHIIIKVPTIQGEIVLDCYFDKSLNYVDEIFIRELKLRTWRFLTALQTTKLNKKVSFKLIHTCQMVFVPNRWQCQSNRWFCDGDYSRNTAKRTRVIMCAKYSGRKFKGYTDYTSWEHELGHLFGVFGMNHTIRETVYNKSIRKDMYI